MRKYRFIWIASLMAVVLLVATCAPKPAPTPVPGPPATTPVSVAPVPAPATPALTTAVKLPAIVSMATAGVGSNTYIVGSAFAEIIGKYTPMKVTVEPSGGTVRWIPLMKTKEVDFGIGQTFLDVMDAYYGVEYWKDKGPQPVLHMNTGHTSPYGFLVTDPKITSIADFKGKKIYGIIKGTRQHEDTIRILFREAGLKPGDVEVITYADLNESTKGIMEGKAVGMLQVPSPIPVVELDRAKPLYGVPVPKEMADKVREQLPDLGFGIWKKGEGIGKADIPYLFQIAGISVRADLDPEVVYTVLTTIYAHYNEYKDKHPLLKEWTLEQGVSVTGFVPMHPGSIKYFKEKGLWKAEHEALQQKALAKPRG